MLEGTKLEREGKGSHGFPLLIGKNDTKCGVSIVRRTLSYSASRIRLRSVIIHKS